MTKKTAIDPLLAECEPYFMDGVHTIAQFAQRTQEIVTEAVERNKSALVEALGFSDKEISLVDYSYPTKLHKAKPTDELNLGVKLSFSKSFEAWIYRYWAVDENPTGIVLSMWINGRPALNRLTSEIENVPDEPPAPVDSWTFDIDNYGTYYITRELSTSEIGELDLRLDELITYYIRLVTAVGGVRRFLTAESSVDEKTSE